MPDKRLKILTFMHAVDIRAYELVQNQIRSLLIYNQKMKVLNGILRNAFSGRRKKIQNSLSSFEIDWRSLALDQSKRADQLTMEDYLQLTNSLTDEER